MSLPPTSPRPSLIDDCNLLYLPSLFVKVKSGLPHDEAGVTTLKVVIIKHEIDEALQAGWGGREGGGWKHDLGISQCSNFIDVCKFLAEVVLAAAHARANTHTYTPVGPADQAD